MTENLEELCAKCGRSRQRENSSLVRWIFSRPACRCESNSAVSEEQEIATDPDRFPTDRYKPLKALGKGGVGAVYLCRDREKETLVAIKVLHALSSEQLESFEADAAAIARVNHPRIARLLDFGPTPSGVPYMVLEYCPGMSLRDYLDANGPLPIDPAIDVFVDLTAALALAHSHGVFHRDISSSNVLVSNDQNGKLTARLIDFSLAHIDDSVDPQLPTLAGTPAYMAPDIAHGLEFDQRSEIYSLGCMLFECLTGVVPFLGRSAMETINLHASQPFPKLSDIALVTFPAKLQAIVDKCLAKDPDQRFQSMDELRDRLAMLTRESSSRPGRAVTRKDSESSGNVFLDFVQTITSAMSSRKSKP